MDRVKIITTLRWVHSLLQFNGITAPLEDLDNIIMMLKKEPIRTNDHLCAMLRQVHDALACSSFPPRRKWVGLKDEEMSEIYNKNYDKYDTDMTYMDFYIVQREVEAKLREKNGYN